ncbi:protein tamozhennic [Anoplophora glabripennis]|uniref:protein tamozhennic n=1 Tax=Anoplophora glabripennis TaxID=217634 RepID=UPI0008755ABB|nr:protein tamozhennic [Anoplophora glabripennis]XP_018567688.1 protein tamozhennic [Anoplophora glabripennis]XP_018567696.1 protein tamozhennic [Anoplophora glabripennis]XP_018567704.1 protein tamozhennic [Anoplophora glabripennis]XP_018567713.1 protein tamozhennic [Anoplophora glabripennis]
MVIMENYYSPHNRIYELWQEIEKCHLSYLEMEESPEKIEQRNKLEEYIHNFLCVATHSQKFMFQETQEVLQRSASNKKDFSGYKAATGFNAIQLYAGNLLSQPWRKEYRQIKTYCGFYKHQIEANLVGAEILFEVMGYKHYTDGILELDGPLCPDRVAAISKDCLIAYVECQIMKAIWEELSSSFKISWLEVLEFRKTHLCGPEQAIKALRYRHHQRQYQEHTRSYSQGSDSYVPRCQPIAVPSTSPVVPINHSFPPLAGLSSHHHVGLPPTPQPMPQYVYANGCCANNYSTCGAYAYMPYSQPMMKPNVNGYYFTNGYPTPPMPPNYQYPVPTGPLIDLEPHNGGYDVTDRGSHKPRHTDHINNDLYKIKDNEVKANIIDKENDKEDSQFEDWDYVYRNLESQGYSKDLGERGDVLSPNSHKLLKDGRRIKETNLDEALNNLMVNDRPLKVSEAIKRLEQEKKPQPLPEATRIDKQTSPTSSYENLNTNDVVKKPVLKTTKTINYAKTKSLPRDKPQILNDKQPQNFKTLDVRKTKEEKIGKSVKEQNTNEAKPSSTTWQCRACTYLNDFTKDICDMCSKSRITTMEQPMEIGGAECSKCTLVNPKNLKICEACGASLKGSPTYI